MQCLHPLSTYVSIDCWIGLDLGKVSISLLRCLNRLHVTSISAEPSTRTKLQHAPVFLWASSQSETKPLWSHTLQPVNGNETSSTPCQMCKQSWPSMKNLEDFGSKQYNSRTLPASKMPWMMRCRRHWLICITMHDSMRATIIVQAAFHDCS